MPRSSFMAGFENRQGFGVTVQGVPELIAKLSAVNRIARIHVGFMMGAAAEFIQQAAIEKAPQRTGNLKTSIQKGKGGPYTWFVYADTTTGSDPGGEGKNKYEYAGFVEYGTSKMAARPFLGPSVQEGNVEIRASLAELAKEIQAL